MRTMLTPRRKQILEFLQRYIEQHGYAPTIQEIGRNFHLSSTATVHKHLTNLQEKGFIKRAWNRSRSVEMVPTRTGGRAVELPLLGYVAAGVPIEAIASKPPFEGSTLGRDGWMHPAAAKACDACCVTDRWRKRPCPGPAARACPGG